MHPLRLADASRPLRVLFLGAHSDDIEIGCGGTVLTLAAGRPDSQIHWTVLSGREARGAEAKASAAAFLEPFPNKTVEVLDFRDTYFPRHYEALKDYFADLKNRVQPDVVFTHQRDDRHQDHRLVCELTWNAFRDHFILEYEIPKYDGGLGDPNVFVKLDRAVRDRKLDLLLTHFPTQRSKSWFNRETLASLMTLRALEAGAAGEYVEAFYSRKAALDW